MKTAFALVKACRTAVHQVFTRFYPGENLAFRPWWNAERQALPRGKPGFAQVFPWVNAGFPTRMLHFGEIMGNGRWRVTVCSVGKITFILVKGNSHIFEVPCAARE